MKCALLAVALASITPRAAAAQASRAPERVPARNPASVTGRYRLDRTVDGCLLDVAQRTGGRLRFQLFCDRGAPSYDQGFLEGTTRLANGVAVYRYTGLGGLCELRMTFRRGRVEMVQTERDGGCGFGLGVVADGTYRRVRARPSFNLARGG